MAEKSAPAKTGPALRTLGQYELISRLAVGGMAEVFLARQRGLGQFRKLVVVKAIHTHLCDDADFVKMLLDEARISALIKHPNIVDIYDLGKEDGRYFIALEYLAGQTLGEVIKAGIEKRKLDVYSSIRIIADIAGGLSAAHNLTDLTGERLELVHRDVSPANVMVLYDGTVKLLDFGVAKASGRLVHTGQHSIKGKIGYMAPEQLDGQRVDRRTDIFGLGVVMWELLAHKRLFTKESPRQVLREIRIQPWVPPSVFRPEVPNEIDAICRHALQPDPAERFQSAADFKKEIEILLRAAQYHRESKAIPEYMNAMFADRLKKQRMMVKAAAQGTSKFNIQSVPDDDLAIVEDLDPPRSVSGVLDVPEGYDRRDTEVTEPDETMRVDPVEEIVRRSRKTGLLVAGLVAVAAVGIALAIGYSGSDLSAQSSTPVASNTTAKPGAATDSPSGADSPAASEEGPETEPNAEPEREPEPDPEPEAPSELAHVDSPAEPTPKSEATSGDREVGSSRTEDVQARRKEEREARRKEEREARRKDEREARRKEEREARRKEEREARRKDEREARRKDDADEAARRAEREARRTEARQSRREKRAEAKRLYQEALRSLTGGSLGPAKAKLRDAIKLSPGYAPAHRALGVLYQRQGKAAKARREFKKYLQLAPRAKDADAVRRRLEGLGG